MTIKISELYPIQEKSERENIAKHVETHFGTSETVIHLNKYGLMHLDVHVIPPNCERDYYLLITSGMSERSMRSPPNAWKYWPVKLSKVTESMRDMLTCDFAELVVKLPPEWKMPLASDGLNLNEALYWPLVELYHLVHHVHNNDQWYLDGHVMRNRNHGLLPFAENTKLMGWIFIFPPHLPLEFSILKSDSHKLTCFLQIVPAYLEEIIYAIKYGTRKLFKRFAKFNTPDYIDIDRKNTCL